MIMTFYFLMRANDYYIFQDPLSIYICFTDLSFFPANETKMSRSLLQHITFRYSEIKVITKHGICP